MLRIGYARVSTQDQSVDMQVAAMERYGVKPACIFTDTLSGAHAQRPGFIEAIRAAQQPGSEFVVWKLDRLGRTVTGVIDTMQLLDSRGVRVYSLTERLDLGTPFGKAMVGFLAVFSELERNLIRSAPSLNTTGRCCSRSPIKTTKSDAPAKRCPTKGK